MSYELYFNNEKLLRLLIVFDMNGNRIDVTVHRVATSDALQTT